MYYSSYTMEVQVTPTRLESGVRGHCRVLYSAHPVAFKVCMYRVANAFSDAPLSSKGNIYTAKCKQTWCDASLLPILALE